MTRQLTARQRKGNTICGFFGWVLFYFFSKAVLRVAFNSFYGTLLFYAMILFLALLTIKYKRYPLTVKISGKSKVSILVACALLGVILTIIPTMSFLRRLTEYQVQSGEQLPVWVTISISCCLTPVVEELFHRRILYSYMRQQFGPVVSILACAAVFGFAHGSLVRVIPMIIFGIIMCFVYEMTAKVRYTILIHVVYNTFAAFFTPAFLINSVWINYLGFSLGIILAVILVIFSRWQPVESQMKQ